MINITSDSVRIINNDSRTAILCISSDLDKTNITYQTSLSGGGGSGMFILPEGTNYIFLRLLNGVAYFDSPCIRKVAAP